LSHQGFIETFRTLQERLNFNYQWHLVAKERNYDAVQLQQFSYVYIMRIV